MKKEPPIKKICFLRHENLYESKRYFSEKFSEALQRQGIDVFFLDIEEGILTSEHLRELEAFLPDLTCSFHTILPLKDGRFFWDILEIPHLFFLLDPAIYAMDFVRSPYMVISCVDPFDCEILKKAKFSNTFFLPHAVERDFPPLGEEERLYDVVFFGSCYDHESLRKKWEKQYSKGICHVIEEAASLALNDSSLHFLEALTKAWDASGLDPAGVDFSALCFYVDYYVRGKDRVELIRSIKEVEVHIFGEICWEDPAATHGWSFYLSDLPNVVVHPGVSFAESLRILRQSKICLNSAPFFRRGSHERIFAGLASGCCVITSESAFTRQHFSEKEGVFVYQHPELETVSKWIHTILSGEQARQEMAVQGYQRVMQNHTWDHRAVQLKQAMASI